MGVDKPTLQLHLSTLSHINMTTSGLTKKIGDLKVPAPGFGAMGIYAFYGERKSKEESKQVLRDAIQLGCTFWDTADMYGAGHNEELIGEVLREGDNRSKVFLATKFGNTFDKEKRENTWQIKGSPDYVRSSLADSLERLGVDSVDLYYQHRVDRETPIEDTVKAMDELRKQGKFKYLGLSECSADTLRKACKVAKVDALQVECSPWALEIEQNGLLEACRENGVTIVAYSPLGRGFLTGRYKSPDDFEEGDFRKMSPRFSKENFPKNLELVKRFEEMAEKKGCTAGQLCLAWVMAQGDDFIPIPGTKSTKYLKENFESRNVKVSPEEDKAIREVIASIKIEGTRYPEAHMHTVNV